ncbi:beta-glucanase, partial [candidate division KSB1 bacterium]|nr:beta-glucanase [candidate division KSB1 bacterium]
MIILGLLFFACSSSHSPVNTSFHPGDLWLDDNGVHINAHGGGILWHDGVYYWFGEHKVEGRKGNAAWVG